MKLTLVVVLLGFIGSTVMAGNLANKNKMTKAKKDVAALVEEGEKACGSKLKVDFEGAFEGWNDTISLGGSCGNAAQGLGYMCAKGEDNKKEGAKIKRIICKSDKTASVTVKGDTITYVMDTETGGMTSEQIAVKLEEVL